jgi:hypothetical protein
MVHPRPMVVQAILLEAGHLRQLPMFARTLKNTAQRDWAAEAKDCRNRRQPKTPKARK